MWWDENEHEYNFEDAVLLKDVTVGVCDPYNAKPSIVIKGSNIKAIDETIFGVFTTKNRWESVLALLDNKYDKDDVYVTFENEATFTKRLARIHYMAFMRLAQAITKSEMYQSLYADDIKLTSEGSSVIARSKSGTKDIDHTITATKENDRTIIATKEADNTITATKDDDKTITATKEGDKTIDVTKDLNNDISNTINTKKADAPNTGSGDILADFVSTQEYVANGTIAEQHETVATVEAEDEVVTTVEADDETITTIEDQDETITTVEDQDETVSTVGSQDEAISETEDITDTKLGARLEKTIALINADEYIYKEYEVYIKAFDKLILRTHAIA